ncbi:MAG: hypothetical protein K0U12_00645 [Gammaproteobacteria bacterium]|nr:hypothetical protein [Gammaproteobacteria bacterium]
MVTLAKLTNDKEAYDSLRLQQTTSKLAELTLTHGIFAEAAKRAEAQQAKQFSQSSSRNIDVLDLAQSAALATQIEAQQAKQFTAQSNAIAGLDLAVLNAEQADANKYLEKAGEFNATRVALVNSAASMFGGKPQPIGSQAQQDNNSHELPSLS